MSIASELNNLEGNIEDSYDAVNDMGGIIPAQRNMDNLDQAIRTIPQNTGTTYTAGYGIDITSDVISVDNTTVPFFSDLATVATTGDYGDLLNTPTIPTVNDATLTIQHNGTNVQTFTANQSTNATANIETIWADTIAPATPVAPITGDMIDFSTLYISADTPSADITVGTGAIIQSITLTPGKWRVFSSFRLSCGGMTANQTRFFYCGFKNGTTTSSTSILQIPMNLTADVNGSGRGLVTIICKEITATSPYVVSSYVQSGELPTTDLKIYRDPGIQLFAMRVG